MKKLIFTALIVALVASCTRSDMQTLDQDRHIITFGGTIDLGTKVDETSMQFLDGEKIKVYGYRSATSGPTANFTSPAPFINDQVFTYNTVTGFTCSPVNYWQLGQAHNFYAYYPSTLTTTNTALGATTPLTVVAATGIASTSDIMTAKAETALYNGASKSADLKFFHRLSKVRFEVKTANAASLNLKLSNIEFKMASNAGTVNLATGGVTKTAGSVTLGGTAFTEIQLTTTAQPVAGSWMVLPDDVITDMILTIDEKKMKVEGTNTTVTTVAGKITVITITVDGKSLTSTTTIKPWDTAPLGDVPIEQYSLLVDKTDLNIIGVISTGSVAYTTDYPSAATATSQAAWITSVSAAASLVTFSVADNPSTTNSRTSTITITAGRISKKITITQEAKNVAYVGKFGGTLVGNDLNGWSFSKPLYAQLTDEDTGLTWWNDSGESIVLMGTDNTDGRANTWRLRGVTFLAANKCFAKNSTAQQTHSDALLWYLPSKMQLASVYVTHLGSRAGFAAAQYWSSSESSRGSAWGLDFSRGLTDNGRVTDPRNVRCVREF